MIFEIQVNKNNRWSQEIVTESPFTATRFMWEKDVSKDEVRQRIDKLPIGEILTNSTNTVRLIKHSGGK